MCHDIHIAHYTGSMQYLATSATSPSFAYMSNPAPDSRCAELLLPNSVRFSCCSRIASICFNCCFPFVSAPAAAPRFIANCSPIASASAAAPRLPTAPRLRPLQLLLPDCMHPLVAPAVLEASPCPGPMFSNILRRVPR